MTKAAVILLVILALGLGVILVVRYSLAGGESQAIVWDEFEGVGRLYVDAQFVGHVARNFKGNWVDKNGRLVQQETLSRYRSSGVWVYTSDRTPFESVR